MRVASILTGVTFDPFDMAFLQGGVIHPVIVKGTKKKVKSTDGFMAYTLPVFNLTCNLWRPPSVTTDPPDDTFDCQLYIPSRGMLDITPGDDDLWQPPIYVRAPKGTDIRQDDILEVDDGDGWYYRVRWIERMHRGFSNEYFVALVEQSTTAPPVSSDSLLLESGDHILLEDGSLLLME